MKKVAGLLLLCIMLAAVYPMCGLAAGPFDEIMDQLRGESEENKYGGFSTLDELLLYWQENGSGGLNLAYYVALTNHKEGQDYILEYDGKSYHLTYDELHTIKQWIDGEYSPFQNAKSKDRIKSVISNDMALIKAEDFFFNFNFYAALLNTRHSLSLDNVNEVTRYTDGVLYKTVFNGCEILSLELSADAKEVQSIHCTWAKEMPGAQNHLKDFLVLLMESLFACGFEEDTASEVFDYLGSSSDFSIGDSDEMTIDGISVGYKVERGIGVSFTVEKR